MIVYEALLKNMVPKRCRTAVIAKLEKLGLAAVSHSHGEVVIKEDDLQNETRRRLGESLSNIALS